MKGDATSTEKIRYAYNTVPEWQHSYYALEEQWVGEKPTPEQDAKYVSFALYFDEPTEKLYDCKVKLVLVGTFKGLPQNKIYNNPYPKSYSESKRILNKKLFFIQNCHLHHLQPHNLQNLWVHLPQFSGNIVPALFLLHHYFHHEPQMYTHPLIFQL